MTNLKKEDLLSLEEYSEKRSSLRDENIALKKERLIKIGDNVSLLFENKETVQNKLQELLRDENVIQSEEIQEKLSIYKLLLPDTNNLKASMFIGSDDKEKLDFFAEDGKGIDKRVWIQIGENDRVFGSSHTNAIHAHTKDYEKVFVLEFDFSNLMVKDFQAGMVLYAGIDHPKYNIRTKEILKETTTSLAKDFL